MAITQWQLERTALGQKEITVCLCDDDPVFLRELHGALDRAFAKLNIRGAITAYESPEAIDGAALAGCSMAFLDIDFERGEFNGMDLARRLRQANRDCLIFFVTNFIEYAPAGYEVQAFRYILKRDLREVLERYLLQAMEILAGEQVFLRLLEQDRPRDLPLKEITYLEVMDHYVSVHRAGATYVLSATLTGLEKQLEEYGFLRIHKSYLVNMEAIRKFRSRECALSDGTVLMVSEKNYAQQKQKYLLWKGLK